MRDAKLWQRIINFQFDGGTPVLKFVDRLIQETRWRTAFADKAIEEYLRFIYLVAIYGELTPSKVVDEVWHLHLTYTQNYWEEFCAKVVGKPIHHNPTRGGWAENERFADAYARTLKAYNEEFKTQPPVEYWPQPGVALVKQKIQTALDGHYVFTKREVFASLVGIATVAIVIGLLARGSAEPAYMIGVMGLLAILTIFGPHNGGGLNGGSCGGGGGDGGGHGGCGGHGCGGGH